ncbi:MAG TPA: hypothetical protein VF982_05090 [Anaerolineales bacterium]|jgi:hypothetical protein
MDFKLNFPQSEKQNAEQSARDFCSKFQMHYRLGLERLTYKTGKNQTEIRMQINLLRDEYHRKRGSGYCSRLVQLADCVSYKLLEIVSRNTEDWNNYQRGQQFRRLDELLAGFVAELFHSRQTLEPAE